MKTYLEFVCDVKRDVMEMEPIPSFDEFMDWMAEVIETADDPEAKACGACYRKGGYMYFADRKVSCWKFCEAMARLFGYMEADYLTKGWHYVAD